MRREMQQAEQERAERSRLSECRQEASKGDQGSESSVSDAPLRDDRYTNEVGLSKITMFSTGVKIKFLNGMK
jgi:hypothetical protein